MPTLGHRAYLQLREKLASGEFPPGSQLVNRTVSQAIGMSMTPVREAVARLASEGVIEHIPGSGAFVRKISRQEFAQLYDLREVLEPFAAGLAAEHITSNELDELRAICRKWRALSEEMKTNQQSHATAAQMSRWNDHERCFHELIYKASRNIWLIKIVGDLQLMTFGFCPQRAAPEFLTLANAQSTYRGHVKILKSLRDRDAARMTVVIKRHIRIGRKRVLEFLDERATHSTSSTVGQQNQLNQPESSQELSQTKSSVG